MECPVCYREWDSEQVIPRNLPCGHSYCEPDLKQLWDKEPQGIITCPTCCQDHKFPQVDDIYKLVKNWAVIAYAETFAQQKKELAASLAQSQQQQNNLLQPEADDQIKLPRPDQQLAGQDHFTRESAVTIGGYDKSIIGSEAGLRDCSVLADHSNMVDAEDQEERRNTVDQFLDEEPPTLLHNQKCDEHEDEFVVAYNKLTYQFLCSQCVSTQNLQKDYYQVYPSMINRILERIERTRKMIGYRRAHLEQSAKYIKKVSKQTREDLTKRFQSHVETLQAYFEDFRKRQSEILNDALQFQEARTEDVCAELDEQLEKLDNDSSNLNSLENHEDSVLVFMNDIIDDIYKGMRNFAPDINLEGLKIEVEIDDDVIARIDKTLSRSVELMHVSLPALDGSDRVTETYRDMVKNVWNCLTCGAQFGLKQVECPLCKTFRPIETYENILHKPESVTLNELEALKLRRKIEKQIILDLELNGEEEKQGIQEDQHRKREKGRDHWYMISSDWLFKWKCFVTSKISKTANASLMQEINQSGNPRIGILPPGPITNYTLFVQDGIAMDQTFLGPGSRSKNSNAAQPEIKSGLVVELDYKTVKKTVWSKFVKLYGGGPAIVREKPQIYSQAIEENLIPAARLRSPSPMMLTTKQRAKKEAMEFAKQGLRKKLGGPTQSKRALDRLYATSSEVNSSIIAVDGNLAQAALNANYSSLQVVAPASQQPNVVVVNQEPPKNIFAKKLNNKKEMVAKPQPQAPSPLFVERRSLGGDPSSSRAQYNQCSRQQNRNFDEEPFGGRGPQMKPDESNRLKKEEQDVNIKQNQPLQKATANKLNSKHNLSMEEDDDCHVEDDFAQDRRNQPTSGKVNMNNEKKQSKLAAAFPALMSPRLDINVRREMIGAANREKSKRRNQQFQNDSAAQQMYSTSSRPSRQMNQAPQRVNLVDDQDSHSSDNMVMDTETNNHAQQVVRPRKNTVQATSAAVVADEKLEQEAKDRKTKSPNPANRYLKDPIIFSPKFGGEKAIESPEIEGSEEKKQSTAGKVNQFPGVLGSLLSGNPEKKKRAKAALNKQMKKEQPPQTGKNNPSSGGFGFF